MNDKEKAFWVKEPDLVEEVLCKDCMHYNADGDCGFRGECRYQKHYRGEGEREDNG